MSICSFCNGTKVEPGQGACVWCECADIQPIGDRAIEVVTDPAKLKEMISRLMEVNNRLLQTNQALQDRLTEADEKIDQLKSGAIFENGAYWVELAEDQWSAIFDILTNYSEGDDEQYILREEDGRGIISEILIALDLVSGVE